MESYSGDDNSTIEEYANSLPTTVSTPIIGNENCDDIYNGTTKPILINWSTNLFTAAAPACLSLYAAFGLVTYEVTLRRRSRYQIGGQSTRVSAEKRLSMISRILCIITSFLVASLSVLQIQVLLSEQAIYLDLKVSPEFICVFLASLRDWILVAMTTLVYSFLWARQRVFYINPALRQLNGPVLRIFSHVVAAFWSLYFISSTILLLGFMRWDFVENKGCRPARYKIPVIDGHFKSWIVCCAVMQLSVLILFIYPIIKRSTMTRAGLNTNSKLFHRVRKAAILTVVCIATDVISFCVAFLITNKAISLFCINACVNQYSMIFCFDYWKIILCPCTKKKHRIGPAPRNRIVNKNTMSTSTSQL